MRRGLFSNGQGLPMWAIWAICGLILSIATGTLSGAIIPAACKAATPGATGNYYGHFVKIIPRALIPLQPDGQGYPHNRDLRT